MNISRSKTRLTKAERAEQIAKWERLEVIVTGTPKPAAVAYLQGRLDEFAFQQHMAEGVRGQVPGVTEEAA